MAVQGLSAVSVRLEAKDAWQAAMPLVQAMQDTTNPMSLQDLAHGLSAASARLEAKEAATSPPACWRCRRRRTRPPSMSLHNACRWFYRNVI